MVPNAKTTVLNAENYLSLELGRENPYSNAFILSPGQLQHQLNPIWPFAEDVRENTPHHISCRPGWIRCVKSWYKRRKGWRRRRRRQRRLVAANWIHKHHSPLGLIFMRWTLGHGSGRMIGINVVAFHHVSRFLVSDSSRTMECVIHCGDCMRNQTPNVIYYTKLFPNDIIQVSYIGS